ncbi:class I SAM-dependent methyltransferase [Desulfonatronovibrio magnus]|uniref:class I SAM-dependent methyltransferase n=1 Tax=Desulfonatronovibrio magnus TaxID=698827 RepID=UPI0005EACC32|nr:class I SAM-dependent methyltransferase [Desulfonatronovibrio magnus]
MNCRLCGRKHHDTIIDFGKQPIVHHYLKAKDENYSRHDFVLNSCETCGFIYIKNPIDPAILYENYFTISSWKNQPHVPRLVDVIEMISGINENSKILDIGCNDGSFLDFLKNRGYVNVFGVEPTKDSYSKAVDKKFTVYNNFFDFSFASKCLKNKMFDLITTRQVLEHIFDLDSFLEGVEYILKDDGLFVIEIPDSEWNLDLLDYALWEEHINYFTLSTINQLLKKHSFSIIHHEITLFSGRALILYCEKRKSSKTIFKNYDRDKCFLYKNNWPVFKDSLHEFVSAKNKPIVVYGCGARSANFVNFTEISKYVYSFVDDQQEKQNLFIPGSGLPIMPSDNLPDSDYFYMFGVNTENEYKLLQNKSHLIHEYCSILPPSKNIPGFWKRMVYDRAG